MERIFVGYFVDFFLGKQMLNCERHSLYLFGALGVVRCTLTHIYIYSVYIYIYILYIYNIASFSLQFLKHYKSKLYTTTTLPYLQRNDTLMWHLAVFHILYKILIKVKEQFARKLFENSFHFHIRALMGIGIIWQYKNDLEFGA